MLLNLRAEYASGCKLTEAMKHYSESDVLQFFSNEDEYRTAVKKYRTEGNVQELTVLKNEIDRVCDLITAETSRNLKEIRKNQNILEKSHGHLEMYYFCEIYPLERNIAWDSFRQAVLLRESLKLRKIIDRLNKHPKIHEYQKLSAEIDLLESEDTSYELLGTLNELRYKTGCFII